MFDYCGNLAFRSIFGFSKCKSTRNAELISKCGFCQSVSDGSATSGIRVGPEWRTGNGSHGMGMKVSAREWRVRALKWKACNRMSFPHLDAITCI